MTEYKIYEHHEQAAQHYDEAAKHAVITAPGIGSDSIRPLIISARAWFRNTTAAHYLSRVVGRPAIAVRDLVSANLGLNGRSHQSSDTGNHEKAPMLVDFRATKGLVWRHDPVRRVAIVLDLRHGALLHG